MRKCCKEAAEELGALIDPEDGDTIFCAACDSVYTYISRFGTNLWLLSKSAIDSAALKDPCDPVEIREAVAKLLGRNP